MHDLLNTIVLKGGLQQISRHFFGQHCINNFTTPTITMVHLKKHQGQKLKMTTCNEY